MRKGDAKMGNTAIVERSKMRSKAGSRREGGRQSFLESRCHSARVQREMAEVDLLRSKRGRQCSSWVRGSSPHCSVLQRSLGVQRSTEREDTERSVVALWSGRKRKEKGTGTRGLAKEGRIARSDDKAANEVAEDRLPLSRKVLDDSEVQIARKNPSRTSRTSKGAVELEEEEVDRLSAKSSLSERRAASLPESSRRQLSQPRLHLLYGLSRS